MSTQLVPFSIHAFTIGSPYNRYWGNKENLQFTPTEQAYMNEIPLSFGNTVLVIKKSNINEVA